MKRLFGQSFRSKLFLGFLVASLIPLLLCSAMLLQIFRLQLDSQAELEGQEQLDSVVERLDGLYTSFYRVSMALKTSPYVAPTLKQGWGDSGFVYNELFSATEGSRNNARFDLYGRDGQWLYSTQSSPLQKQLPVDWGVLCAARNTAGLAFSAADGEPERGAAMLRAAVQITTREEESAGYLVITMDQDHFQRLLSGSYGGGVLLLDAYWRPVYASRAELAGTLAPALRQQLLDGEALGGGGEDFTYSVAHQPDMGLYALIQKPRALDQDTRKLLNTVTLGSALVCVAISVLMGLRLSRQMFRPIQRLQKAIGEVGHNNLDVYVPPGQDDELGQLAQRFNGMVAALKRNQEQLVANQRELNQAQIRMLQAQLNPHFLCNTLDTMKWISKINQVPQVAVMSTDLADILRFCISPEEFVPLWREVEILRRYVEIQTIRLSGRFTFSVELPRELEACLVPKMLLQPIVENAILHGLEGVEDGAVQVRAWTRNGEMNICVSDNGVGLPEGMIGQYVPRNEDSVRGHLGLYNVDTILKKHYGPHYGLLLDRGSQGVGTAVTATLPVEREEDAQC